MPAVAMENVTKRFAPDAVAVRDLTLHVGDGELLALVGPSGCGKSTTLRLIAGLEKPTAGTIRLDQRVVNDLPPAQRNLALVFQRPALYPHRTVRDNLGFSLELQQRSWRRFVPWKNRQQARDRHQRVQATARLLGLDGLLERYPGQLSGGQQQRVALGRALVRKPSLLLLDEPLCNLDAGLRQELRRELHLLQRQLQATMIYVTHDPVEALSLGDRVAVMQSGRLQQVDRPAALLGQPANRFVAGFLCWPAMNFLDGEIQANDGGLFFVSCAGRLPVPANLTEAWGLLARRPLTLAIRPENVRVLSKESSGGWPMQVRLVECQGPGVLVTLTGPGAEMSAWVTEGCQMRRELDTIVGRSKVMVQPLLDNCCLFDRLTGATLAGRPSG